MTWERSSFWVVIFFASLLLCGCSCKAEYKKSLEFDFEPKVDESFKIIPNSGSITHDPNEVISGDLSLKIDSCDSEYLWNEGFSTVAEKGLFKSGGRYEISFKNRICRLVGKDSYFYFVLRSRSKKGADKGLTRWRMGEFETPLLRHRKIAITPGVDDYELFFGVYGKGAIVIDEISIKPLKDFDWDANSSVDDEQYSPYGMCVHFDRFNESYPDRTFTNEQVDKGMKLLCEAGVQWIRVTASWGQIKPTKDDVNDKQLARIDYILNCANSYNIGCYIQFLGTPRWASSRPEHEKFWAYGPSDMKMWQEFVEIVVSRYKDRVKYWEIWNEVDWIFWYSSMDEYADMLKVSYEKIKEIDPESKVVLAGMAFDGVNVWETVEGAEEYALDRMYKAGIKDYFDIMAIHPYSHNLETGTIDSIHSINSVCEIMARYGDSGKAVWLNEIGMSSLGNDPNKLAMQGEYLREVYTKLIKHPKVDKIFWYNFRCKTGEGELEDNLGIVNNDFGLRPSYDALKSLPKLKGKRQFNLSLTQ